MKEVTERFIALALTTMLSPLLLACAIAVKFEGVLDPSAAGPIFLKEQRVSRGRIFSMLKFRTIDGAAALGLSPTDHIATYEQQERWTKVGRLLHQWYLDELPQLLNILRGDMFLIGTRPWPVVLYEAELARGRTLKRDMPAGLIGPVQARKGRGASSELDREYWEAFQTYPAWRLLLVDAKIVAGSIRVQLEHRGL